ncbi:MAG: hypothetical protein ABSH40_04910 [Bryobacteraceae bacterium]
MSTLPRLLAAIHSHPRWGWAALMAYAAAVTFPHENVQWLVNEIAIRITHRRLYQVSAAITVVGAAWLTWILARRLRGQAARRTVAAFWIVTLALIWCTWRIFTANNVELVHYPQYIPEGMALLALTLSPAESLAWIALFGGLDECFQYWVLANGKPVPFDFNDVYMDLLGGAAGVLLAMAFLRCDPRDGGSWDAWRIWKRPGIIMILAVIAVGLLLWSSGLMLLFADKRNPHYWFALSRFNAPAFWFQVPLNGPNKYHTLSPVEGPILILGTIGLYAAIDRRVRISVGPR